ncbi:TA system VapC family ribonuclease toxin [Inquilinus limosus]|uniref:Ribonuclease VapC n=1 Tax=Inquilinus limosus TaxID=171674 RepID=A0A211ZGQ7_9PROT|nr:TA system VapC family ribonuclease toxin [Inquilinus limosus]OWJ64458.1 VapC toxin family PIN domain ribonuclease [Inquilinus limosus]
MIFLLDVNVLIALIDPGHVQHDAAHDWFVARGRQAWATCPLTENGVLRIVGHPRYPNSPGSPAAVMPILMGLCALPGHTFWPDDISLMDSARIDPGRLLSSGQLTDTYLLALALAHHGQLATFDRRLVTDAVHGGSQALHLIS